MTKEIKVVFGGFEMNQTVSGSTQSEMEQEVLNHFALEFDFEVTSHTWLDEHTIQLEIYQNVSKFFRYVVTSDGCSVFIPSDIAVKSLLLPNEYEGQPVVDVAYEFRGEPCERTVKGRIENVFIPSSYKKLSGYTFYNMQIKRVYFMDSVEVIHSGCFAKNNIEKVELPQSLLWIGDRAFMGNKLKEIQLPENLNILGESSFENNHLKRVVFNKKLSNISKKAFKNNLINQVDIPESVRNIEAEAFHDNRIEHVSFPEGLVTIDLGAFLENSIQEVEFPRSLKKIGSSAFEHNEIHTVIFKEDAAVDIDSYAFAYNFLQFFTFPQGAFGVTEIASSVLTGNVLTTVTIPEFVREIGAEAFYRNDELKEIIGPEHLAHELERIQNSDAVYKVV